MEEDRGSIFVQTLLTRGTTFQALSHPRYTLLGVSTQLQSSGLVAHEK